MKYYQKQIDEIQRTLDLSSDDFIEVFNIKEEDKLSELEDLLSDIKSDLKIFKENYIEEPIEEDNYEDRVLEGIC